MAVSHRLIINQSAMHNLERAYAAAAYKAMDALKTDVIQNQVMPFDTGTMQNTSTYVAQSQDGQMVSLITRTPYAARVYFHPEYNFNKRNNANAQGRWLDEYLTGSKQDFLKNKFAEFFRQETGQ